MQLLSPYKEEERRSEINYLAKKSADKNLYLIYSILEKINPGCTKHINCNYHDKISKKEREFDIITSDAIYEIKSGTRGRNVKQFKAQMEIAKNLKKDHVVFSPNITNYQVNCLRNMGINIYNNINDFIEMEKKRK